MKRALVAAAECRVGKGGGTAEHLVGDGAAAMLVRSAMDEAHSAGCDYIVTETAGGMEGIFERCGWAEGKAVMRFDVDLEGPPPSLNITGEITFD